MPFYSIIIKNFRNIKEQNIKLSSPEVFFIGKNGQGKTNLLESLYMASYGSSFRTRNDNEIISIGENTYSLSAFFKSDSEKSDIINIEYKNNKKKIVKNAKIIKDRKDLIQTVPTILFSHEDLDFIIGEPEKRRFFIDQCLSMHDIIYIDTIRKYKKILKNKNIVLKEEKYDLLDIYDEELIKHGIEIVIKRKNLLYHFNTIFTPLYEKITGIENVSILYNSQWDYKTKDEIKYNLLGKRESEKIMKTSLSGPHRDRITFIKDKKNFVNSASTGQKRTAALLLRICQSLYFIEKTKILPVLLMDDVLLELDPEKRKKITSLLPEYNQLFCTFLPGEPYESYKKKDTLVYKVEKGIFTPYV